MSHSHSIEARAVEDVLDAIKTTPLPPVEAQAARTVEDVLKAIKTIPLPPLEGRPQVPGKAGDKEGFTNAGSLQAFDLEQLGFQARDDSLHWTLFGQLAADYKYDRQTQVEDWYKYYVYALGQIGMVAGQFNWASVTGSDLKASVDATILYLIKAIVSDEEFTAIEDTIKALANGNADGALTLFNKKSSNSKDGNFQVSSARTDDYDNLTIKIGYFYFNTTQNITNMLFWKWTNTSVAFTKGNSELTLSKTLADKTRAALIERLGDRIVENIDKIPF